MKCKKWMCLFQCTSGFINDGDQLKVTCPSCHKSFCAQCKKSVSISQACYHFPGDLEALSLTFDENNEKPVKEFGLGALAAPQ